MTVEAKYFDRNDKELASIQAEGKIGSGAFGGAFDYAIEKTAREIALIHQAEFPLLAQISCLTIRFFKNLLDKRSHKN